MSSQTAMTLSANKKRRSLRTSLFFQVFFLLLLCAIGTALVAFILARHEFLTQSMVQLRSTAQSKGNLFAETIARQQEQLSTLGRDASRKEFPTITRLPGFSSLGTMEIGGLRTFLEGNDALFAAIPTEIEDSLTKSESTLFIPVINEHGWDQYLIAVPRFEGGKQQGVLVALFDATPLAVSLFRNENSDKTTKEIVLITRKNYETFVLHQEKESGKAVRIYEKERARTIPLIETPLSEAEGMMQTKDYAGIAVLAAYRSLPSLGWSVVAKIDTYEVEAPIIRLSLNLVGVSLMFVVLLSLSMYFLARRIVGPLEELSLKLQGLEVRRWSFTRSIFTGNELESVDEAATDLATRLRSAHEHLEDIVAKKSMSLKKEFAENKTILESMDYGLVVTDNKGMISYMNAFAATLTNTDLQQSIGKSSYDILAIIDKDNVAVKGKDHPISSVLATQKRFSPPIESEYSLKRNDGTTTPLHIRATPILVGQMCLGVVAIFRDVAEERRIDHMKTEFISLVSHQLRTPLSAMRWYLEMLLSLDAGPLTADQKDFVEEVAMSNTRMVHLVNALLNVSRLELGEMQVNPESIDAVSVLAEIVKTFDIDIKRKNVTLETKTDTVLGASVHSDRGLLQLIMENLMSNAVKYAKEGSVITIIMTPDKRKKEVILTITNIGIEIPEDQKRNIGKKLFRATNARFANTDGNGLGLYISHVAADTIGAKIDFVSTKKETSFTLTIPM